METPRKALDEEEAIAEQAHRWFMRRTENDLAPEDEAQFEIWLQQDPRHRALYAQAHGVWGAAARMGHLRRDEGGARDAEKDAVDMRPPWARRNVATVVGGVAAALALVITGSTMLLTTPREHVDEPYFATTTAEIREVALDDGTVITLGAESEIDVRFSTGRRQVTLLSGEAFFDVAKDPSRPFFVDIDDTQIRVVGTAFDVRRGAAGVDVSVLEGIVEVRRPDDETKSNTVRVVLEAGEQVVSSRRAGLTAVTPVSAREPGAWRQGRLVFDNVTLREVIADLDRYYDGDIVIDGDAIATMRVTASYRTDDIDKMLANLERLLPIEIDRSRRGRLTIRPNGSIG